MIYAIIILALITALNLICLLGLYGQRQRLEHLVVTLAKTVTLNTGNIDLIANHLQVTQEAQNTTIH